MWGWCKEREDFRLFKLNRMDKTQLSERSFTKREAPVPDLSNEKIFPGRISVKALFEPECKWRLIEEFGIGSFVEQENGKLLFQADYTDVENLISWLLTFGDRVELLEPVEVRERIADIAKKLARVYSEGDSV